MAASVEFVTKSAHMTSPFKSRSNTMIRKNPKPQATNIPFNPYILLHQAGIGSSCVEITKVSKNN